MPHQPPSTPPPRRQPVALQPPPAPPTPPQRPLSCTRIMQLKHLNQCCGRTCAASFASLSIRLASRWSFTSLPVLSSCWSAASLARSAARAASRDARSAVVAATAASRPFSDSSRLSRARPLWDSSAARALLELHGQQEGTAERWHADPLRACVRVKASQPQPQPGQHHTHSRAGCSSNTSSASSRVALHAEGAAHPLPNSCLPTYRTSTANEQPQLQATTGSALHTHHWRPSETCRVTAHTPVEAASSLFTRCLPIPTRQCWPVTRCIAHSAPCA